MLRFIVGFSWFALMVSCHTEPGVVVPDISGKDSTQVIDTSVPSDSELTDTSASAFEPMAMIAIHVDPGSPSLDVIHATPEHLGRLMSLVEKADSHGFKLTLLMGPDWVDLIQSDPVAEKTMQSWVENGHQLGYHHHTCAHTTPDGYRDVKNDPCGGVPDRGSVALAFGIVRDFGASLGPAGTVDTAAQGLDPKGKYRAAEWQEEAIYATGPINDNSDGHSEHRFITLPRCAASYGNRYSGQKIVYAVPELGHAQLDVGGFVESQQLNNLAALTQEIATVRNAEHLALQTHLGLVFHAREYVDNPRQVDRDDYPTDKDYIDAIFDTLAQKGIKVKTARELLQLSNPCANP